MRFTVISTQMMTARKEVFSIDDEDIGLGNATVIDLATGTKTTALDDCGGGPCLVFADPDGDITGLQRRNTLDPIGGWSRMIDGCLDGETDWRRVVVDADIPVGTEIDLFGRTAASEPEVSIQPWIPLGTLSDESREITVDGPMAAAGVTDAPLFEIGMVLRSVDHASSPRLRGMEIQWSCSGVGP